MNWQEACLKSKDTACFRVDKSGDKFIREMDGSGTRINKPPKSPFIECAKREDMEGYSDWVPLSIAYPDD